MKLNKRTTVVLAGVLLLALVASAGIVWARKDDSVLVPEGTAIRVSLDRSISSATSQPGDVFEATVAQPVFVDGKTVIPAGSRATGTLVNAQESGRLSGRAQLRLALSSIEVNGDRYDVNTSSVTRWGGDHKKRNWAWIGGGAAGGTFIGALAGGVKGGLIGGPVGAGAGVAVAAITGKKTTRFHAEQELTFKLTEPLSVKTSG
jgi:hypothetical protein